MPNKTLFRQLTERVNRSKYFTDDQRPEIKTLCTLNRLAAWVSSTSTLIWRMKLFTSFRVIMLSPFLSAFCMQLMIQLWLGCKADVNLKVVHNNATWHFTGFWLDDVLGYNFFFIFFIRIQNLRFSTFLISPQGYCSLFCWELRFCMLVMTLSNPVTHFLAFSLLLAIRSRLLRLPLKMMEKHRSSIVLSVCFFKPSDWRPRRTESMSSTETDEKMEEI